MRSRAFLAAFAAAFIATAAFARADTDRHIFGVVRELASGRPIAGAAIVLNGAARTPIATATSDRAGRFIFLRPNDAGVSIAVSAIDYRDATASVTLDAGSRDAPIVIALERAAALPEIGRVASRSGTSSDSPSAQNVGPQALERVGALRLTDALGKLSGVTVSGDPAAPGGDAYVGLRGLRAGESQTLLDGHPIGPIGVAPQSPDADGTVAGFNYQDAPYFALRDVAVSFGAAGTAGGDTLGGTVDLLTIEPTLRDRLVLEQGLGDQGRAFTSLRATGTAGKFGYALVYGVIGTYGAFAGTAVAQTGLRGTDLTGATLRSLTYHVSGDYALRNELAKFTYALGPATRVSLDAYDATSWADKTGEGDNDFNAPGYVLANAPVGTSASCPRGVAVLTDGGPACYTAAAYAGAASGPAGGGSGAWQALRNQDYTARITSVAGHDTYALDAFADRYAVLYHRDGSAASGPLDAFLNQWSTRGLRAADTIVSEKNVLHAGASWLRQTLDGDGTTPDGTADVSTPAAQRIDADAFVRDVYSPNRTLSFVAGAWLEATNAAPKSHVDPQAAIVVRPSVRDTFKLSFARATDETALQSPRVNLVPAGALNPDCGAIARASGASPANVEVGSGPARDSTDERGNDLEFSYERRFRGEGGLALTLYDTNVASRIATGDFSAGSLLPASAVPALLARIDQFCGVSPAAGAVNFTLSRTFNIATARLRGLEFTGRTPLSPHLSVDYGYDVTSIVANDLPASVLANDSTLVNGLQVFGIPLHKGSAGLDALFGGGFEFRLDGHYVGPNNPQQLPGYAYADASLGLAPSKRVTLLVAASNVFGSHVQRYGLVGEGLAYPTNAFNEVLSTPALQPFNERYGLAPASVTVSATAHL